MRRAATFLLVLAAVAAAQDREDPVRVALDAGHFAEALALAEAALAERPDDLLRYQRAQAINGIARGLRREKGYVAAIDYLEPRLDHVEVLRSYAACCLWGGEEERGLRAIRAAAAVTAGERLGAELWLLTMQYRYEEAAEVAHAAGWPEWESWARDEAALRGRLHARARRAGWIAVAGAVLLLGGWALLRRRFRPSSSAPATS